MHLGRIKLGTVSHPLDVLHYRLVLGGETGHVFVPIVLRSRGVEGLPVFLILLQEVVYDSQDILNVLARG